MTQPDKPKGRSLQMSPSAVKTLVSQNSPSIPIFQPLKASDPLFLEHLKAFAADLFVVVAYGQILSQKLLDIPPLGCINVHASLLPKYRGAAPIQRCLMAGEKKTGIAIQQMVKELDAGDVLVSKEVTIPEEMIFSELEKKLIETAQELLWEVISDFKKFEKAKQPQNHSLKTYASKIDPKECQIDWNRSAQEIHNQIRALSPKPGAWCWVESLGERKRLKILRSRTIVTDTKSEVGSFDPNQQSIACKENSLCPFEVQPEGKKPMLFSDWIRGQKNQLSFY